MPAPHDYSLEARKQRWCDFLDPAQPPRHLFCIGHDPAAPPRPWPWPDNVPERIDWAWQTYERELERAEWLLDDTVPHLAPFTGTEIFAEAFGCQVHRADDNMPFALPLVHNAAEAARVRVPDLNVRPLAMLFEIADELRRRAGNGALLQLVDIQSPMDIAALIWDKNDLYMAMIQQPNAVKDLAAKVHELLVAFLDAWFERYGPAFIAHYPKYYMPWGITLSEDEVGAVNGEMFEEFFADELVALSRRYGGIGIHCCADARHQWDNFARVPDLRLLNLVQPPEELRDAYAFFASRVPQMHSWCGDGEPWTWPGQYPSDARIVFRASAETREEALALSEKLWTALGRSDRSDQSDRSDWSDETPGRPIERPGRKTP